MPDFDLSGELSLKIELHMLRPITEKVHSGNGPVSLVTSCTPGGLFRQASLSVLIDRAGRLRNTMCCVFWNQKSDLTQKKKKKKHSKAKILQF